MSSGLSLTDPALLAALERQRRLSVGGYHRMVRAGVFDEDERLERTALPTPRTTAA